MPRRFKHKGRTPGHQFRQIGGATGFNPRTTTGLMELPNPVPMGLCECGYDGEGYLRVWRVGADQFATSHRCPACGEILRGVVSWPELRRLQRQFGSLRLVEDVYNDKRGA